MSDVHIYRINVGFLINAAVGTARDFSIEAPEIELDDEGGLARDLKCTVHVSKVQQGILAEGICTAKTDLECTHCLEPFERELNGHFEELFCFKNMRENDDAEQYLPETGYMDLKEIIREYLVLEIPYAPICKPDCKGLCPICGANLNTANCHHDEEME